MLLNTPASDFCQPLGLGFGALFTPSICPTISLSRRVTLTQPLTLPVGTEREPAVTSIVGSADGRLDIDRNCADGSAAIRIPSAGILILSEAVITNSGSCPAMIIENNGYLKMWGDSRIVSETTQLLIQNQGSVSYSLPAPLGFFVLGGDLKDSVTPGQKYIEYIEATLGSIPLPCAAGYHGNSSLAEQQRDNTCSGLCPPGQCSPANIGQAYCPPPLYPCLVAC